MTSAFWFPEHKRSESNSANPSPAVVEAIPGIGKAPEGTPVPITQ
eukprot:CAMPEP_0185594018 /NCGR_PEP_ID=MMETSP0434-20130131/73451_1 /TAXON_ID=626734 ORGANISM="Favella taraikaensis, Strain Fe Narragansett Bay" /NCGR_SAMPLE_ID=MMETSP0434 /ASSEMBLY_ACC=CAM_ASM_000379 /LENGTH=44 /DNA_ID= /DNA_START= /DNA_END= /DNA_ORIENTATION=